MGVEEQVTAETGLRTWGRGGVSFPLYCLFVCFFVRLSCFFFLVCLMVCFIFRLVCFVSFYKLLTISPIAIQHHTPRSDLTVKIILIFYVSRKIRITRTNTPKRKNLNYYYTSSCL